MIFGQRKQVVIDLEPLGPLGIIGARDLHQLLIAEVVARNPARLDNRVAGDGEAGLADVALGAQ